MPGEEAVDLDLLRRAAAGDRAAFDEFVERHQAAVYRFTRSLAGERPDAEDALQETFLAAWRGAATFRGEASVRTWLLTIARHAVSRQRRRRVDEPQRHEPLSDLGVAAGWGSETPEASAIRRETRQRLQDALQRLLPGDREVLLLRDVEGLPGDETATVLGVTLPAMKTRLHRARLRLAAVMRESHATH